MSTLPIPRFDRIKETTTLSMLPAGLVTTVMIVPDDDAGHPHRYSVLTVDHRTGTMRCVGRELDLSLARRIVRDETSARRT